MWLRQKLNFIGSNLKYLHVLQYIFTTSWNHGILMLGGLHMRPQYAHLLQVGVLSTAKPARIYIFLLLQLSLWPIMFSRSSVRLWFQFIAAGTNDADWCLMEIAVNAVGTSLVWLSFNKVVQSIKRNFYSARFYMIFISPFWLFLNFFFFWSFWSFWRFLGKLPTFSRIFLPSVLLAHITTY